MRKLVLLTLAALHLAATASAARQHPATTGRVVGPTGAAVDYATVALLHDGLQAAGTTTDSDGRFTLSAADGTYTLQVRHLSYELLEQPLTVAGGGDLGEIRLTAASNRIDAVVVEAQLIRREADRFVIDVANAASAIGKDGVELLERAPGVWINDDKISINGKSGSKIYINDREIHLAGEQLLTYLRNLRTEDIQKIEVIPVSGAEYSADSSAGIIKITLRRHRESGLQGYVSLRSDQSHYNDTYRPSGSVSFHSRVVDLTLSGNGSLGSESMESLEQTRYPNGSLHSIARQDAHEHNFGTWGEAVFQAAPNHSVGVSSSFWHERTPSVNNALAELHTDRTQTTESRYARQPKEYNWTSSLNYVWKIDTLGSTLKLLGDYTDRRSDYIDDNRSSTDGRDSLHAADSRSRYRVWVAGLDFEKHLSSRWTLRAGAKYTSYRMKAATAYTYNTTGTWLPNERQSFDIDYTEQIGAAYAIVSGKFDRWALTAGLRGEYTRTDSRRSAIGSDYVSLFPNANISYALDAAGNHQLIAQYARKIARPSFWSLNPKREQISEYTYQQGNPYLKPSYTHDVSLTLVLAQRYTLTAGMTINTDDIEQTVERDPENPDMLAVNWVNYDDIRSYYVNAALPFRPVKWWEMQLNLFGSYMGQRTTADDPLRYCWTVNSYLSNTFTLPRKFYIDFAWSYFNGMRLGTTRISSNHFCNVAVKKRFGEYLTVTFRINNLLDRGQHVESRNDDFVREMEIRSGWQARMYRIGLTWNFKAGKAFRSRSVEGAADESRL